MKSTNKDTYFEADYCSKDFVKIKVNFNIELIYHIILLVLKFEKTVHEYKSCITFRSIFSTLPFFATEKLWENMANTFLNKRNWNI